MIVPRFEKGELSVRPVSHANTRAFSVRANQGVIQNVTTAAGRIQTVRIDRDAGLGNVIDDVVVNPIVRRISIVTGIHEDHLGDRRNIVDQVVMRPQTAITEHHIRVRSHIRRVGKMMNMTVMDQLRRHDGRGGIMNLGIGNHVDIP